MDHRPFVPPGSPSLASRVFYRDLRHRATLCPIPRSALITAVSRPETGGSHHRSTLPVSAADLPWRRFHPHRPCYPAAWPGTPGTRVLGRGAQGLRMLGHPDFAPAERSMNNRRVAERVSRLIDLRGLPRGPDSRASADLPALHVDLPATLRATPRRAAARSRNRSGEGGAGHTDSGRQCIHGRLYGLVRGCATRTRRECTWSDHARGSALLSENGNDTGGQSTSPADDP